MIIGFDGSRAFQKDRTGTENYSFQILKSLAEIDQKNTYIVYVRPDFVIPAKAGIQLSNSISRLDPRLRGDDTKGWPENFHFKVINWSRLWTQGGLARQTFKDNPDVLFVPAHTLPLIRKPGLKTVVTVHDLGSEYLPAMHQVKQRLYLEFMQKYQLKTATKIIAVSKATKEDLVNRIGIEEEKIKVIYEGFNKDLFKSVKSDALINSLRQYGLKPGEYFLFVGTVQPRKNLESLIKAFNVIASEAKQSSSGNNPTQIASSPSTTAQGPRNDGVSLVIAGSRGWLSDEIYALPEKLGIEERVKFLGYVPEKDLPALYSGAIALTFPSLFEGFGLPILEAQACGCPVLTSNISSMPEVAGKGAILVDPYSVEEIAEGMERVKGKGERVKLIQNGFENVKRFSWEKCAKETLEVLEEC